MIKFPQAESASANPIPSISFEFFPPATPDAAYRLWESAEKLAPLGPDFVSVTYGAGGSTRRRTLDAIKALRDIKRLDVAGHLTCVAASRDEVLEVAAAYVSMGVRRIVALRGDAPDGGRFVPHPEGFTGSVELIAALRERHDVQVIVGTYPEPHPDSDQRSDITQLKLKQDAGASAAITQFFFTNDLYYRFRDRAVAAGVTIPIIPGILPIENFGRMQNFAARCGASIPAKLRERFERAIARQDGSADLLATAICVEQCDDLRRNGVEHLHFYTLNRPELTINCCLALGHKLQPRPTVLAVA